MLDSMMEFSQERLSSILENYINDAIARLKHDNDDYARQCIQVATRRRLFGLRAPFAVNPTPEEAVKIVKEKLNWYGFSKQGYKSRRIQAKMFQDMIDTNDPDSKIYLSVDDHNMLMTGNYSSTATWNSNRWDCKADPAIQSCY